MSLSGKTLANSYKDLLQVDNSNSGVVSASKTIKDGEGTSSSLSIGERSTSVKPTVDTTATFLVENASGTDLLVVDSTNSKVSALGNYINTQYAYFGIGRANSFVDDTHQAVPFGNQYSSSDTSYPPAFGTGTDPATTFTTAEANGTRASDIVSCLWYVTDAISIDSVVGIEGADTATGDTTRMHLFSYDFTSGATACLTNGTLLAHNSDVTNAGSEQPYLSSFTVDSAAVAAGKVILAFFKSDSVNSDYTLNIKVKYHLT
tara:strand:- start:440 stop:1222 length:783 start_codon:yes stop_codon:yes gene_type:complete